MALLKWFHKCVSFSFSCNVGVVCDFHLLTIPRLGGVAAAWRECSVFLRIEVAFILFYFICNWC